MKTSNYLWLFLWFFYFLCTGYSQEITSNYFNIVNEKEFEFKNKFKATNPLETNIALHKSYKKFARWQWFWEHRVDKNGDLNKYHKELFAPNNLKTLNTHEIVEEKDADWKIIGPETFPKGTNPSGIMGIGRIDAIAVNPNNKNHVFIGARAGGIWETYNINDSIPNWVCLTNKLPVFTVNDLKIANNTLYAVTSNHNPILMQGYSRYGLGIIKKKLNANNWQLPNKSFECKNIAISKNNTNILYAVGEKYIYKSIDAGNNWKKLSDPITDVVNSKLFLTNIEINPFDDNKIIVSGRLYFWDSTNHKEKDILLFKSENGGESWENLTASLEKFINQKIEDVNAKDKPISLTKGLKNHISTSIYKKKLFLCIQQMYRPNHVYFVTLNNSWNKFELFNSLSKSNTYYYATDNVDARFKVINDDEILIGNRKLRIIKNKNHMIRGLDNRYKYLHQDIRAIHYDASINRLLLGTDGGINNCLNYNTDVYNPEFVNASGNLNLFLAFNMSYINKNNKRTVRIGTQDTGYYKSDKEGENWTSWTRFGSFGEGMVYTDPIDPNIVYRINAGGHGGNIQKSINGGEIFSNTKIKAGSYAFAPFEIDKNNTNHLVFDNYKKHDRYSLSLSNDQMVTSIDISNGINELDMGVNLALAISKKNPNIFLVARKDFHFKKYGINNAIFKSENFDFKNPEAIKYIDLSANITKLDSTILKKAFITDIEINDNNENELWISFGNLEDGKKVFHSTNGGLNWHNFSFNLPNIPVNTVEYDAIHNSLYVGNDYGVYRYNKTSKQWNRYGKGLPIAMVTSIEIDNIKNEIIAATHGRSVWVTPIIKSKNHIISNDTTWTGNQKIEGDLIIKEGVSLILNDATLTVNNILIEKNASLNSFSSSLISNYKNAFGSYFNTNIDVKPTANIIMSNTKTENFTVNLQANSTCTFYGNNNNILQHTTINVLNNANYLQNINTKLVLKDAVILFSNEANLGLFPNSSKIENINFSGDGSVKTILNK